MSTLLKLTHAASTAIDQLATAPGTSRGDRAAQLSALRRRIDDHIMKLGAESVTEAERKHRPVSQREGD